MDTVVVIDIIWWILIIACFVGAFAALIFPIVPGVPLLWAGALIYQFAINSGELGWFFWTMLVLASVIILAADIVSNRMFLQKSDSSEMSGRVGPLAIIVGAFVMPPFGLLIVPFLAVFATELLHKKTLEESFRVAGIAIVSFLTSTLAKFLIQLGLVVLFILSVIF